MVFHIDTQAIIGHMVRLEVMHKSALPVVVRQTLNAAAFRTKTETMPAESAVFIHRKPTFFIANSKVVPATGLAINAMGALVGFKPKDADRSHSVEDLEKQEDGGIIHNRAFVALPAGRTGNVWQGLIRTKNRRNVMPKVFDSKNETGYNDEQRFIKAARKAQAVGGIVIGNRVNTHGNKIAWSIKKGALGSDSKRMVHSFNKRYVEAQVFSVRKNRMVRPRATHFMRAASIESQMKMEADFIRFAQLKLSRIK